MNDLPQRHDIPHQLQSLVEAYCEGSLTDADRALLESQLRDNEPYQSYFLAMMAVHSGLYWSLRDQSPASSGPANSPPVPAMPGDSSAGSSLLESLFANPGPSLGGPGVSSAFSGWFRIGSVFLAAVALVSLVAIVALRDRGLEGPARPVMAANPAAGQPAQPPISPANPPRPVARVDRLESQVVIERGGAKRQAVVGMDLLADDSLDVPGGGSAELTFVGQTLAKLGPRTTFVLGESGDSILREGFVQIDARGMQSSEQALAIETPDAQARIQGGWFSVGASRKRTQIRVAEGRVFASRRADGVEVEIPEGYCSTIARAVDPDPRRSVNGTALFVVSAKPIHVHEDWERFDQMLAERIVGDRLWRSALSVRVRTYDELQASDFDGCSLVVLSVFPLKFNVEKKLAALKLASLPISIVCLEPEAFPILGLTGATRRSDYGFTPGPLFADVEADGHPLAAGFVGSNLSIFANKTSSYAWGKPASTAQAILRIHNRADRWLVFGYDQGAEMVKGVAPARRVGLFMDPVGIDYDSPSFDLIDAAIDWCLESALKDMSVPVEQAASLFTFPTRQRL